MNYTQASSLSSVRVSGGTAAGSAASSKVMRFIMPSALATCLGAAGVGSAVERLPLEIKINDKVITLLVGGETKKRATHLPQVGPSPGPWVEDMLWIKQKGGVTMSSLADLLGVTRKTLYDWIAGAEPRKNRAAQIQVLRRALTSLPDRASRSAVFDLIDRKLADGSTIRSLIAASEATVDEALIDRVTHGFAELVEKQMVRQKRRAGAGVRSAGFESDFRST